MKQYLRKLSIRQSILLLFGLLLVAAAVNFFITRSYFTTLSERQLQLSIISYNRTLTQRILIEAEEVMNEKPDAKENLRAAMNEYQKRLNIALQGGRELKITGGHRLREANDEEKLVLAEVEAIWKTYKVEIEVLLREPLETDSTYEIVSEVEAPEITDSTIIDSAAIETEPKTVTTTESMKIANPSVRNAINVITRQHIELLNRTDKAVTYFYEDFKSAENQIKIILLALLALNVALLAQSYSFMRKKLLDPLYEIEQTADRIAHGDLDNTLKIQADNEIGKVAKAINNLAGNLKNATEFVKNVGDGQLNAKLQGVEDEKALQKGTLAGELVAMREQMKIVAEEEKQRNWATQGLATFADIFRLNTEDLDAFSNNIIANIVKYLHANQGGLFLLSDEEYDKHLYLAASYAFDRQKQMEKRIEIGEGLVGQCYLEKQSIFLTDVPEEFVRITSGLGGSNPQCLLIVPLRLDKEVFGVIELAAFQKIKPHEIAFLEKLAENITSTIASVKINNRTKKLLAEAQEMADQMRAQEEEMRQNVEELEATQEEMARKENELRLLFEETKTSEELAKQRAAELATELENFKVESAELVAILENEKKQLATEKIEGANRILKAGELQKQLAEMQQVIITLQLELEQKNQALKAEQEAAAAKQTVVVEAAPVSSSNTEIQMLTMNNQAQKELYENRIKALEEEIKRLKNK